MATITTSYGRMAVVNGVPTPYLYGSGYGRDAALAKCADRAAVLLVKTWGLPVEKRGNSSGKDAAACYDGLYWFNLGAARHNPECECDLSPVCRDGRILWHANVSAPWASAEAMEADGLRGYMLNADSRAYQERNQLDTDHVTAYGPWFRTMRQAFAWLRKWGRKYNPTIQEADHDR